MIVWYLTNMGFSVKGRIEDGTTFTTPLQKKGGKTPVIVAMNDEGRINHLID